MKRIAVCLLTAILMTVPLTAQYAQRTMATDLTGSELIFSTTWTLQGETYNPYSKLIHYRSGQLRTLRSVLAERDPATGCVTNTPTVTRPDMSLDGMRYSYTQTWPGTQGCAPGLPDTGEVRNDTGELVFSGRGTVALSANGRWARYESSPVYTVVNLENGKTEELNNLITFGVQPKGRQVADDGTVVIAYRSTALYVKRPGLEREYVPVPTVFDAATLSDSGNFAVAMTRVSTFGPKPVLWWFDLGSKEAIPIATAEEGCHSPSLSTDVNRMVFLSAANWLESNNAHRLQAFVMDLTTGVLKQLTKGTDTVAEAVITGDGRGVFARLQDGSIQLINVDTGIAQEVVAPAPEVSAVNSGFVPGSRHTISLPGNQTPLITLAGTALRVVRIENSTVEVMVPEGIQPGDQELELNYEGSPFQSSKFPVKVYDLYPRFRYWGMIPQIWHDSNGTAAYEGSPARTGEVIEVLLSGLGPVDSNGNTQLGMNWKFTLPGAGQPQAGLIEVLRSRKSPYEGEEGLYRVKLRVPQVEKAGDARLECEDPRNGASYGWATLAVVP
jgi:uncharacterized protein (TIGR03437 family)